MPGAFTVILPAWDCATGAAQSYRHQFHGQKEVNVLGGSWVVDKDGVTLPRILIEMDGQPPVQENGRPQLGPCHPF